MSRRLIFVALGTALCLVPAGVSLAQTPKGILYTGEVFNGERVQRFVPVR